MRFSQRKGYTPVSEIIQTDNMSDEFRNSLWNVLHFILWNNTHFMQGTEKGFQTYTNVLIVHYFKEAIDDILISRSYYIRTYFFKCPWYEVYDFLEFTLNYLKMESLNEQINSVLERELSGYRFIGGSFTNITDEQEITMLEEALADTDYPGVKAHLKRALELMSNRENPDYRNSIKESISAVESLAKVITNNPKATLGDALGVMERTKKLHPALKSSFSSMYGYTSDEGGVRHAMLGEPNLTASDAKFFLLSCTSFINYIKSNLKN